MALSSGSKKLSTPVIGNKAHQPCSCKFPQRDFGKTSVVRRSFQRQWFDRWSWLHYSEDKDLAFYFTCIVAYTNDHLESDRCLERTFISTGFSNWKDAAAKFCKHEGSRCHKDAVLKTTTLPATTPDIAEMRIVSTSPVGKYSEMFRNFSSRLHLQIHMKRNCVL